VRTTLLRSGNGHMWGEVGSLKATWGGSTNRSSIGPNIVLNGCPSGKPLNGPPKGRPPSGPLNEAPPSKPSNGP